MVKTRFAPSPTGNLHIGGARTALVSWLIAKKLGGEFVLRIEDTDTVRSKEEYTQSILDSLKWLGIDYANQDNLVYQSKRYDHYQKIAHMLVDQGLAYRCYATQDQLAKQRQDYKDKHGHDGWKYDGQWRDATPNAILAQGDAPYVIRLKVPQDGVVSWKDLTIKGGKVEIPNSQLDDFIILRSDGSPTYNFCVVVDDTDMQITHVIRGQDHISNTPKQIHIYNALGKDLPIFGHIPLILNIDGSKQSKSSGATSVNYYKDLGISKDALINYLLLISCNNLDSEIFSTDEFVNMFDLDKLGANPIKFDLDKLLWINQQYLSKLPDDSFIQALNQKIDTQNYQVSNPKDLNWLKLKSAILERSKTVEDFLLLILPMLNFNLNQLSDTTVKTLQDLNQLDDFSSQAIHDCIAKTAEKLGLKFGQLVKPFRQEVFPDSKLPLADMIEVLGKNNLTIKTSNALKM
jgi:glutamyl-tRNA synthetase